MNILQKIQNLVMSAQNFDFAVYDLKDGGKIECDTEELGVGSIISVVKEDGTKELAPAGEHTLADGRTIVLDDASKVTEIKESDAPTATEVDAKKEEKMAMEVDPELLKSVSDMIKAKVSGMTEEDLANLANEIVYAITAYDEAQDIAEGETPEETENGIVTNTTTYSSEFTALSEIVLEMAKKQEEMNEKLAKVPTGKAISEMEFKSDDFNSNDVLEARIAAIKNLNK